METPSYPPHHNRVMPYLIVKNAAELIQFIEEIFGGVISYKALREDQSIMHAEVNIGESNLMLGEASDQWASQPAGLFIYVENADETYKNALAAGAVSVMEPVTQDYGRSCGIKDPFGNTWWITSEKK